MKVSIVFLVVCAALLQVCVFLFFFVLSPAQFHLKLFVIFFPFLKTQVNAQDPTPPPEQPTKKIPVQQYHPRAADFLANIDSVSSQAATMRKAEPAICNRMRMYVDTTVKSAYERIVSDIKRVSAALAAARTSPNIEAATLAAKTAIQKVYKDMAETVTNKTLGVINDNCAQLNTSIVLNKAVTALEEWRKMQIDNAVKLANIPDKYEADMQNKYVPLEKIIGTNW